METRPRELLGLELRESGSPPVPVESHPSIRSMIQPRAQERRDGTEGVAQAARCSRLPTRVEGQRGYPTHTMRFRSKLSRSDRSDGQQTTGNFPPSLDLETEKKEKTPVFAIQRLVSPPLRCFLFVPQGILRLEGGLRSTNWNKQP